MPINCPETSKPLPETQVLGNGSMHSAVKSVFDLLTFALSKLSDRGFFFPFGYCDNWRLPTPEEIAIDLLSVN